MTFHAPSPSPRSLNFNFIERLVLFKDCKISYLDRDDLWLALLAENSNGLIAIINWSCMTSHYMKRSKICHRSSCKYSCHLYYHNSLRNFPGKTPCSEFLSVVRSFYNLDLWIICHIEVVGRPLRRSRSRSCTLRRWCTSFLRRSSCSRHWRRKRPPGENWSLKVLWCGKCLSK